MGAALVKCEVKGDGLRSDHANLNVQDVRGVRNWMSVPKDFLSYDGGTPYLPVGAVACTPDGKLFLIEFPQEADNGAHRCWVRREHFLQSDGVGVVYDYPVDLQHIEHETPEYTI